MLIVYICCLIGQSLPETEKPLIPWIIAEASGKVIAGHCNCMAGLGESCSHIASLLWALEAGVRLRDSMTMTQKKTYWVLPPSVKEVPYAPVIHIKFLGRSGSLASLNMPQTPHISSLSFDSSPSTIPVLDDSSSSRCHLPHSEYLYHLALPHRHHALYPPPPLPHSSPSPSSSKCAVKDLCPPSSEELDQLFTSLPDCSTKPAILSLVRGYSSRYVPNSLSDASSSVKSFQT